MERRRKSSLEAYFPFCGGHCLESQNPLQSAHLAGFSALAYPQPLFVTLLRVNPRSPLARGHPNRAKWLPDCPPPGVESGIQKINSLMLPQQRENCLIIRVRQGCSLVEDLRKSQKAPPGGEIVFFVDCVRSETLLR